MHWFAVLPIVALFVHAIDPHEIQKKAIESRQQIRTGEIEYFICEADASEDSREASDCKNLRFKDRLIFDLREGYYAHLDRWTPREATLLYRGEALSRRHAVGGSFERVIVRPDRIYQWYPDPLSNGEYLGIVEDEFREDAAELQAVFHPWKFGVVTGPVDSYLQKPLNSYIAPEKQADVSIVEDMIQGSRCWKIQYRRENGHTVRVWYDSEKEMNVCPALSEKTQSRQIDKAPNFGAASALPHNVEIRRENSVAKRSPLKVTHHKSRAVIRLRFEFP